MKKNKNNYWCSFPLWRVLTEEKGLKSDTDVAPLLLNRLVPLVVRYLEDLKLLHLLYLHNVLLSWNEGNSSVSL